jgi:PAS domain S-box-containing protein
MGQPKTLRSSTILRRQRELQKRLEALDQLPLSFWLSDGSESDFQIVFWNKGAERIYGYSKNEALGHSYLTLFVTDEQRDQSRIDAQRVIDEGTHPVNCIAIDRMKPADPSSPGPEVILLTNVFRYQIDGRPYQAEIAVDLTPSGFLDFLDQQYRQERADPATHEQARQLNYFVRHAQRQVETQLQLWGLTFSHSIRSELGNARDALQSLRDELADVSLGQNTNFRALQAAIARLLNLSDNFHAYQRPPELSPVLSDSFNITTRVRELCEESRYDAESMGLTLELNAPDVGNIASGSSDAFEHAFRNILGNAIDHAEASIGETAIFVNVRLVEEQIEVSVLNPGQLSEQVVSHSYSPFYAPVGTTTQRLHLGLYIANLWLTSVGASLDVHNFGDQVRALIYWPIQAVGGGAG